MFSNHDVLSYVPPPPPPAARRWRPAVEMAPNCPRCDSANTKFCYYNNYSLSQPRYFCKGCRRYWTKGGSLRNVPVGGGCRKNRRSRPSPRPLPPPPPPPRHHSASRPDLMADDVIGGDRSTTGGGAIDLGALYAKYLNQCPQSDQVPAAGMPELLQIAESSDSSSCDQIGHQQMLLDVQSIAAAAPQAPLMDEMNQIPQPYSDLCAEFSSCLPMEHCSSCCTGVEELEAAPEISVHPQQSLLIHDEWSSLDYSSLEAFCRF